MVAELTGREVLHIEGDGDGSMVCRLCVHDPTTPGPADDLGRRTASAPTGWRTEVFADVVKHHRHHEAPQGHKFSLAVYNGRVRVGVAVIGRPVSRELQKREPRTLEVTRVTTWGDAPLRANAVSKLYAAAASRARSLGYDKLITYTIANVESGGSLVAAGWTPTYLQQRDEGWDRPSRTRTTKAPTAPKLRWERGLTDATRRDVEARRVQITRTGG